MSFKIGFIGLVVMSITASMKSQSIIDSVLYTVERNNKTIIASRQYWEANKLGYLTGLSLPNPTIEYEYLFGSPAGAGDQTDILAVQSFDFPSVYKRRRELANIQGSKSALALAVDRQAVLLDAKITCIELVYRNKLEDHLTARIKSLEKLVQDFQTKLERGDGNILDVNKAKLQLLQIRQLFAREQAEKVRLNTHLIELNGGEKIVFTDTVYPPIPSIPEFEVFENEYEQNDPARILLEHDKRISESQLDLSKTWRLPKFEAGYRYQGILGQRFSGIHAGITLPLWEQKNRFEHQQADVLYRYLVLQEHLNEHYHELQELYDLTVSYDSLILQYNESFSAISNITLLDKALALGEITIIEYFLESSFYINATLQYLETEKEYHVTVAKMFKYLL
jgi:outer membrane protein, heavy metal efflux system